MPRYSVTMHVTGRFRVGAESDVNDGAYTRRFVAAVDEASAGLLAVGALRDDPSFQAFRPLLATVPLGIEVTEVRPADWLERGRSFFWIHLGRRGPGYIFYRESEEQLVSGALPPNTSLERTRAR